MNKKLIGDNFADEYFKSITEQPAAAKKAKKEPPQPKGKAQGIRNYRINIAVPTELGEALKAEADRQNRSVNNLMENIISDYLNK